MDEIQASSRDGAQFLPPDQPQYGEPMDSSMAMDGVAVAGANEEPVAEDPNSAANTRKRQEQALMFEKYLEESGLCLSFQIIFTEIIQK